MDLYQGAWGLGRILPSPKLRSHIQSVRGMCAYVYVCVCMCMIVYFCSHTYLHTKHAVLAYPSISLFLYGCLPACLFPYMYMYASKHIHTNKHEWNQAYGLAFVLNPLMTEWCMAMGRAHVARTGALHLTPWLPSLAFAAALLVTGIVNFFTGAFSFCLPPTCLAARLSTSIPYLT